MDRFLEVFSWERLLVVWGLLAPAIAWFVTRRWDRANQFVLWKHEGDLRAEQDKRDEKTREQEEARVETDALRVHMRDTYTRFLATASMISLATEIRQADQRTQAIDSALRDFTLSFQQLLLVASVEVAAPAVDVWKQTVALTRLERNDAGVADVRESLGRARSRLVAEARNDLDDPVTRNANPGITIRPALTAGGFHLDDVG